jgi:hypothetical protein
VSPPRDPVVIDGGDRACVRLLLELRARIIARAIIRARRARTSREPPADHHRAAGGHL